MIAQRPGRFFKHGHAVTLQQRRIRVLPRARPLEGIAARLNLAVEVAGFARKPDGVLELVVVFLQLVVGHRIILDGGVPRDGALAVSLDGVGAHFERPRTMPPRPAGPVETGAAEPFAPGKGSVPAHGPGDFPGVVTTRDRRAGEVLEQLQPAVVLELVVDARQGEFFLPAVAAAFQPDHLEAGLGQLGRHDAAGPTHSNHHCIYGFQSGSHDSILPSMQSLHGKPGS